MKNKNNLNWDKRIITGHNGFDNGKLIIRDKYLMLDRSFKNELLVLELNSMNAMIAKRGKKRLIKIRFGKRKCINF
ncbi:MAG: hypothetical protein HC877_24120 [Thioploca sp.]|nr:hypothetical protein [Thioploca sp.]